MISPPEFALLSRAYPTYTSLPVPLGLYFTTFAADCGRTAAVALSGTYEPGHLRPLCTRPIRKWLCRTAPPLSLEMYVSLPVPLVW